MYMRKKIIIGFITFSVLLFAVIAIWFQVHCRGMNWHPLTIELKSIELMQTGSILIEEKKGEIFVTVVDRYGDSHRFLLKHDSVPKNEAVQILSNKKLELEKVKNLIL